MQCGLVGKSGAWYSYQGSKIGQGKANSAQYLEDNPAIMEEIETQIRAQLLAAPEAKEEPKETAAAESEDDLDIDLD